MAGVATFRYIDRSDIRKAMAAQERLASACGVGERYRYASDRCFSASVGGRYGIDCLVGVCGRAISRRKEYQACKNDQQKSKENYLVSGEEAEALRGDDPVHLVGPADYGFEDALRLSMITASSATAILLNYNHSIGSLVDMNVIKKILEDALAEWSQVVSSKSVYMDRND